MKLVTCFLCNEYPECPYDCKEQIERSKQMAKEWDNEKALTQEEVNEIQLEFKL